MNNPSDQQFTLWAKQISRSNRKAFDELFRSSYPVLVRFAVRYTRDRTAACDVVQECFFTLWKRRERVDPEKSLKSFLYTMVRNRALNLIRDRSGVYVDHDVASGQSVEDSEHPEMAPGDEDSLQQKFTNWIGDLPERQKEAFQLSRFEGLDHEEIAGVMDVSPKTVNNHIVAALRTLRECYDEYQQEKSKIQDV